jgi:hypothetical protein
MPNPANNGGTNMASLNYATDYLRELAMAYPYQLYFNALRSVENDRRFRWVDSKTIKIQNIETTGAVDADRDLIELAQRNYQNAWETKTLSFFRKWSTLVHPEDMSESRIQTIGRITDAYNQFHKFPEKDAYLISKLYSDWTTSVAAEGYTGKTAMNTAVTASNVIQIFDEMRLRMRNARVPATGIMCYVTHEVMQMLENTDRWTRSISVQNNTGRIDRGLTRLDGIEIVSVPQELMQTMYDFTVGHKSVASAGDIQMFMVHPSAVITPEIYETSMLDSPTALSENKYIYYEERYEDVFILNKRADALQFDVKQPTFTEITSPSGNPKAQGYVELDSDNEYVYSEDTTVDVSKTYYARS